MRTRRGKGLFQTQISAQKPGHWRGDENSRSGEGNESIWLTQQLNYFNRLLTRSPNRIPEFLHGLLEKELVYLLWTHILFHCLLWFSAQIFTLSLTLCLAVADVFLKAHGSRAALQWPLFKCLLLHTQISLRLSFPPKQCSSLHLTAESISISLPALFHISIFLLVISTSKFCAPQLHGATNYLAALMNFSGTGGEWGFGRTGLLWL